MFGTSRIHLEGGNGGNDHEADPGTNAGTPAAATHVPASHEPDDYVPPHLADLVLTGNIADLDAEDKAHENHLRQEAERKRFEDERRRRAEEVKRLRNLPKPVVVDDPIPATTLRPAFSKVCDVLVANGVPEASHKKVLAALEAMHETLVGVAAKGTARLLVELIDPTPERLETTDAMKTCSEFVDDYMAQNNYNDRKQQRHECYIEGPPQLTKAQRVDEFNHQLRTVGMRIMSLDWDRSQLIEAHAMCKGQKFKGPFQAAVVGAKRERAEASQRALMSSLRSLETIGRATMAVTSTTLQTVTNKYEEGLRQHEMDEAAAFARLRAMIDGDDQGSLDKSMSPTAGLIEFGKGAVGTSNGTTSLSVAKSEASPSKRDSPTKAVQSPDGRQKGRAHIVRQKLSPDGRDIAFGTDGDTASVTDKRFLIGLIHDALISAPHLLALVKHAIYSSLTDVDFEGYDENPNGKCFEVPMQLPSRCEVKVKSRYDGCFDQLVDISRVVVVCDKVQGMCEVIHQVQEMESKGEVVIEAIHNGFAERQGAPNFDLGLNGGFRWGEAEKNDVNGICVNLYLRFVNSPYLPKHMKSFPHICEVRFVMSNMHAVERAFSTGVNSAAAEWAKESFPSFDPSLGSTGSLNSANDGISPAAPGGISTEAIRCGLVTSIDLGSIMHVDVGVMNELAKLAKVSLDPCCRLVEIKAANTSFGTNLGALFSSHPPNPSIQCHKRLRALKLSGAELLGTL